MLCYDTKEEEELASSCNQHVNKGKNMSISYKKMGSN